MKTYFNSLNSREQKLLLAAGIVLLIFFPYQFIYSPFQNNLLMLEKKVDVERQNIQWMKNTVIEIRQLKGAGGQRATSGQSLLSLIETTAKRGKLRNKITKVQPDGSSKVRIWLEELSFDDLMRWMDGLVTTHGLTVNDISIEKQAAPGIVNARLNMSME